MTDINLGRYQTIDIVKRDVYPPGTVLRSMEIRGNAMLSSVYVKAMDAGATLKVNYFQTSTGDIPLGERHDLNSHPLLDDTFVGETDQIVVTRIHNKPHLEFIITGGNVEFGVYVTVNDELASDIDSALVLDGQTGDLTGDKGIPTACYDEDNNQWRLLRCNADGTLPVSLDAGTPFFADGTKTDVAAASTQLASFTVPANTTRKMSKVIVSSFGTGIWTLTSDGSTIAKGRTGPGKYNSIFEFNPKREIATGLEVVLNYQQISLFSSLTVDHFIMASDFDT